MDNCAYMSATELLAAMQANSISSTELIDLYIDRYEKFNPAINAIVATDFDLAKARAREADNARVRGESWGSAPWLADNNQGMH
jgi:amidase